MLDDVPVTQPPGAPEPFGRPDLPAAAGTPGVPGNAPWAGPTQGPAPVETWPPPWSPPGDPWQAPEEPLTPRAVTLAVATVTTALLLGGLSLVSLPYASSMPGPTFDTLGEFAGEPLIDVTGVPSYPSEGELRFTTVQLRGGPGNPVSVYSLVDGWLDGTVTVRPVEDLLPPDQTQEEIEEENQAAMISSQENATVSALEELGYEVPTTLTIQYVLEESGAFGVVEEGDVLVAVDGTPVGSFRELSAVMDAVTMGDVVRLTVVRDGAEQDLDVETVDDGAGGALIGVLIDPTFDLPVDVRIQIENVGGPSAGLMFSLGVISVLTEADETGGEHIAGTGTMDLTGRVGPIGGIVQKMTGAERSGADWFLAPVDNCAEAVGNEPSGLHVIAVETLEEARAAVTAIGEGRGDALPTCASVSADR